MARRSTPRITTSFPRTPTAEEPCVIVVGLWRWHRRISRWVGGWVDGWMGGARQQVDEG